MDQWLKIKIPKELREDVLPTNLDIIRGFLFEKNRIRCNKAVAGILSEKISKIYLNVGIETIRKDKIKEAVRKCYESRLSLLKTNRLKRFDEKFVRERRDYLNYLSSMFDMASKVPDREQVDIVSNLLPSVINPVEEVAIATEKHSFCNCKKKRKAVCVGSIKLESLITNSTSEDRTDIIDIDYAPVQKTPSL